jgi:glycolate oxidase iron-sulfur subunit
MQTFFEPKSLKDSDMSRSNSILRNCVHCGFCTATCPTYQVLGDELDSPRGRIYLIKDMLENKRIPDEKTVEHIDRCLSCLACMTTCPSGVNYMHLVDHARSYIDQHYKRPLFDRLLRFALAKILPFPIRFRLALVAAKLARPFARLIPSKSLRAMIALAPKNIPPVSRNDHPQSFKASGVTRKRVALMTGCAQRALNTDINDATIRLLQRLGCEIVIAKGQGCCGALTHHMGKTNESHATAAKNIKAWRTEMENDGLDAIIINTSGCGTTVKDYGQMFRNTELARDAEAIASITKDVTEFLAELELPEYKTQDLKVAYHAACSLQHGQQVKTPPKMLLKRAGFDVVEPADSHLCCGSAGTYNLLQPEISTLLKSRKVQTLEATNPDIIATGNLGCMMQIGNGTSVPIVHTVELLDWASGGPVPAALTNALEIQSKNPKLL